MMPWKVCELLTHLLPMSQASPQVLTGSIFPLWNAIKGSFMTEKGYTARIMKVTIPIADQTKESSENPPNSIQQHQETVIGLWIPNTKVEQVSLDQTLSPPDLIKNQIRAQIRRYQETESSQTTKRSTSSIRAEVVDQNSL
jgi:hypothetical protein